MQRTTAISKTLLLLVVTGMMVVIITGCSSPVKRGDQYARKGDWDSAVSCYREAYQKKGDPQAKVKLDHAITKAGEMHFTAGQRAIDGGDYARAINDLTKALSYENKEHYREALKEAKIGKKKQASDMAYRSGVQQLDEKDIPNAISHFRKALDIYPDNVQAKEALHRVTNLKKQADEYYQTAMEERDKKNWDEAISYFDKSLDIWSTNSQAKTYRQQCVNHKEYQKLFSKALAHIDSSEWEEALESLLEAQKHVRTDEAKEKVDFVKGRLYQTYFSKGEKELGAENWDKAVQLFEKAHSFKETEEVASKLKEAYYGKWLREGEKFETMEKFSEAYQCYRKAQNYKPTAQLAQKLSALKKHISQNLSEYLDHSVEFPFLENNYFLTACSHLCGQKIEDSETDLVRLTLSNKSSVDIPGIKVKVELQGFSEVAVDTVTIPAGKSVVVNLTPTFKKNIKELIEERPGNIYYAIYDSDGNAVVEKTKKIKLCSRNDMLLSKRFFPFICVFVTPNDKRVDKLVSYAAEKIQGRTVAGYLRGRDSVKQEVKAIFDTLSELGIHYRSATVSYLSKTSYGSQKIYFPAESLEREGANCIDGTCLFASCLEKIGLRPYIVLVPGHAFIAVLLEKNNPKSILPIETTMIGTNAFHEACNAGIKTFNESAKRKTLQLVDIKAWREKGIKPFPLSLGSQNFSLKDKLGIGVKKIYEIKLDSAVVVAADFAGNKDLILGTGGPEIYVRILLNNTEKINTRNTATQDSYSKSWSRQNISTRITIGKGDVVKLCLYDKDLADDDLLFYWELKWEDFVSKVYNNLKTRNGSQLKVTVKEVK